MMGHEFKEHGDGVHPPLALVSKNLRASATTSWGRKRRNNSQRTNRQPTPGDGDDLDIASEEQKQKDVDMDAAELNRKRTSDQILGAVNNITPTGLELALVPKGSEGAEGNPVSPPPKQDPK
jgi:hypothetical protein